MSRVDITFVRDYTVSDAEAKSYRKGEVASVAEASARHFISRGAAVEGKREPEKGAGGSKKKGAGGSDKSE